MSDHRIAFALHNYELEQTIIRLRNSRNRLIQWAIGKDAIIEHFQDAYRYDTKILGDEIVRLREENSKLQALNRELSEIIAAP